MITKLMPRRIPDYPDIYWTWNYYSSVGSFISIIGLFVFFYLVWNMLSLNVIHLQYKNILYILIKSSNNQKFVLSLKKFEYELNKFFFYLKINLIYIFIYLFLPIIVINMIFSFIYKSVEIKFYIFNKYNFNNFFEKSNFYSSVDRFYYSIFVYNYINIWNLAVKENLNQNTFNLLHLLSYNYILIYTYFIYFDKLSCKKIINLKFKFIILQLYLKKFVNSIYLYIFFFTYKKELFKFFCNKNK